MANTLVSLPNEVLHLIGEYVGNFRDVTAMAVTCRRMSDVAEKVLIHLEIVHRRNYAPVDKDNQIFLLHRAIRNRNMGKAFRIINTAKNMWAEYLDVRDDQGYSVLQRLVTDDKNLPMVIELLEQMPKSGGFLTNAFFTALVSQKTAKKTIMHMLPLIDISTRMTRRLTSLGIEPLNVSTLLIHAAVVGGGDLQIMQAILDKHGVVSGGDTDPLIDGEDCLGRTAMFAALTTRNKPVVELLLQHHADPRQMDWVSRYWLELGVRIMTCPIPGVDSQFSNLRQRAEENFRYLQRLRLELREKQFIRLQEEDDLQMDPFSVKEDQFRKTFGDSGRHEWWTDFYQTDFYRSTRWIP